ncbi:MAG: cytochrome c [Gammaproteobacteria bacterium]|nr:cytochrome c [Gammaproteobacteria bacterium]
MKLILKLFLVVLPGSALATDIENGNDLHFEYCTGCHDSGVYTRADRKMGDLAQLGKQVRFCQNAVDATWFDDEVDDVIEYLNATYYHF